MTFLACGDKFNTLISLFVVFEPLCYIRFAFIELTDYRCEISLDMFVIDAAIYLEKLPLDRSCALFRFL